MSDPEPVGLRGFVTSGKARWVILAILVVAAILSIVTVSIFSGTSRPERDSGRSDSPGASMVPDPTATATATAKEDASTPSPAVDANPDAPGLKDPVPLDGSSEVTSGVTVSLTRIETVQGEADGPGEVAAPSVRLTLTVVNSSTDAIDLSTAVTTASFGAEATPASELTKPGGVPFPTSLDGGASTTGVFVFSIPVDERSNVSIKFDYSVGVPVTVFEGAIS